MSWKSTTDPYIYRRLKGGVAKRKKIPLPGSDTVLARPLLSYSPFPPNTPPFIQNLASGHSSSLAKTINLLSPL